MKRFFFVLVLVLLSAGRAFADTRAPIVLLEEDTGNGYRYEAVGIGTFTVNGKDYETIPLAVIELETEMDARLFRDGEEVSFQDAELILEEGSYELYLYPPGQTEGLCGVYHFNVENSFQDMLGEIQTESETVENPPLELTYEKESGLFTYTLPDGKYIQMNVPMGGTARHSAKLILSEGLTAYTMRKDGEAAFVPEELAFYEPGHYEILVLESAFSMTDPVVYRTEIWFTLKNTGPEDISLVNAPYGLWITAVRFEGEELEERDMRSMVLKRDGTYEFEFSREGTRTAVWSDTILRDTAAPALRFEFPVEGRVLKKEVKFLPPGRGVSMQILCNGMEATASQNRIGQSGRYEITVWDGAGNSRTYHFEVKLGVKIFSREMIIVLIVLLLAVGALMVYWRRNMRVI